MSKAEGRSPKARMKVPREALRRLCAEWWNPIGFPMAASASDPDRSLMPADEYDTYLLVAWGMAVRGRPAAEIVDYLASVEREQMGLRRPSGDKQAFVAALQEMGRRA